MSASNGTKPHTGEARAAEEEIHRYELKVNTALRKMQRRESYEPSTSVTPLEEIFASEESPKCPHCSEAIELPNELEQYGIRCETIRRLAEFCAQDGLEPWNVMRNLYAVFSHMSLPLWSALTLREKAQLLGDSHGSQHGRIEVIVNFLRRKGAYSIKAPGQKKIESRESFSKCQQGNTNRKRQHRPRHRRWKEIQKKQKL